MKLFHQTGHNYTWNIQSFEEDHVGTGLIYSPLNIEYPKLQSLDPLLRSTSIFDPQLFQPSTGHKGLVTYKYFPTSILDPFSSSDYSNIKDEIAKRHIDMLTELSFPCVIIPNKYIEIESTDYFDQVYDYFIKPHCDQISSGIKLEKYLTIFVNKTKLIDDEARDSMLDWLTGLSEIDGIYLIFDLKRTTKQIKEPDVLAEALFFINILKISGKKVIIGYSNSEGIMFSIANPDAITCGSYENLRNFSMTVKRFSSEEKKQQHGPSARLYSALLFQWIEYTYIGAMRRLYPRINEIFPDSKYKPLLFSPTFKWHFQKAEPYKHYFLEIAKQVDSLSSDIVKRKEDMKNSLKNAIHEYEEINKCGILFDTESDGSHLYQWLNAITYYEKLITERL